MKGRAALAAQALPFLAAAFLFVIFPSWTVDDAYTIFRYAENLATHGALTWNPGESPVEGYTGIVLPLLLAFGAVLGIGPEGLSEAVGILALFSAGVFLIRWLARMQVSVATRAVTAALFLLAPFSLTHATSGLETTLFAFALVLAAERAWAFCADPPHHAWSAAAAFALTALVRPEGLVFAGTLGLACAVHSRWSITALKAFAAACALPVGIYLVWRFAYYGRLFPNPYYVKTIDGWNAGVGAKFLSFAARYLMLPVFACVAALLSAAGLSRDSSRKIHPAAAAFAVSLMVVAFQYLRSDLLMNYSFRFFSLPAARLGRPRRSRGSVPSRRRLVGRTRASPGRRVDPRHAGRCASRIRRSRIPR
ncbi:MAG: hypothetical protein M5R36_14745 [Deltaproteobacteria bacterium]|nr:hypothetical protein [Deltaproteobacteria bacterium]